MHQIPIRRALVSVYDKTGLDDLVRGLHDAGVALVSTGGSAARIESLGIPVTKVEDLTGFPECLDGRVKTLHPKVHAGILADRRLDSHVRQLEELGIEPFDLVVSNLYPFRQTVAVRRHARRVRRADRHRRTVDGAGRGQEPPVGRHRHLARVVRRRAGRRRRRRLHPRAAPAAGRRGVRAHRGVRRRGGLVDGHACWRRPRATSCFPDFAGATFTKVADLRYGENPHQAAVALLRRARRAGRAPSSWPARRCPTTTTSTPTPPGGPRGTSTSRRWRSSSTPTPAASPSVRTSPRHTGWPTSATPSPRSAG